MDFKIAGLSPKVLLGNHKPNFWGKLPNWGLIKTDSFAQQIYQICCTEKFSKASLKKIL